MSHIVGTVQFPVSVVIGPDSGAPADSPSTWLYTLTPAAPPNGPVKLVLLHFSNVNLPGGNRLEVDLGYDTDVFTGADGTDIWTRPVNVAALAGGQVPVRYVAAGAAAGSVTLDKYGRGERHTGDQDPGALSNCDPFLRDSPYVEPIYDPLWFCHTPPNWENAACVAAAGDTRKTVAPSVGMVLHVGKTEFVSPQIDILETCTVTLIGPDLVITAGHCMGAAGNAAADPDQLASSSVCFGYATACDGSRPAGYAVQFHKVKKSLAFRHDSGGDYCILQLETPPAGLGLPHVEMRADLPAVGESLFGLHHPNGAPMKLSVPNPGFATANSSFAAGIGINLDVSGGSSGSGIFDLMGRIVGVLSNGKACGLSYFPTASILRQLATPAIPAPAQDVMLVLDRSGSMSQDAGTGRTKMHEAQDAASLFVQLIRTAAGDRVGMVSFSTTASNPVDFALAGVNPASKDALIGPAPYSAGMIGTLAPSGATSIGDGLDKARLQFPGPGVNARTILLMTDGMQNTPPMIADIGGLGGIAINAIGFGVEGALDGPLLTQLAENHDGLYVRAGDGLSLKKYFALAFGDIFEMGALMDPEFLLAADIGTGPSYSFNVCGEETITVVAGWDNPDATLLLEAKTPGGTVVYTGAAGLDSASGVTWTFLRIPLPHGGERDGAWSIRALRLGGGGEFPPPAPQTRAFINIVAKGGPRLRRMPGPALYYTGDKINPRVLFGYTQGEPPENAKLTLTVSKPARAAGAVLAAARLKPPALVAGDTIPARATTLIDLAKTSGPIGFTQLPFVLAGTPAATGWLESDGLYGLPLDDLLTVEGTYTFHIVATYGAGCVSSRELQWSVHVSPAIDPQKSGFAIGQLVPRPGGGSAGVATFMPRDPYGNLIGPGRLGDFGLAATPGTSFTGQATDNGDGTYTIPIGVDANSNPGVVVAQPGRPPIVVASAPAPVPPSTYRRCRLCWIIVALLLCALLIALWLLL